PERGSFIAEPRDLGGPIGAGAPKGRIQITVSPCRAPSSSLCASSSRVQPCACPWARPFYVTPGGPSCVLLCSTSLYLPFCEYSLSEKLLLLDPKIRQIRGRCLCLLQLGKLLNQLLQSESWKLYSKLGIFPLALAFVHRPLAIFGMDDPLPRLESLFASRFGYR